MYKMKGSTNNFFKANLNCFVLWDRSFIGTGKLLNTLIPVKYRVVFNQLDAFTALRFTGTGVLLAAERM
jgi:hypothetical protein